MVVILDFVLRVSGHWYHPRFERAHLEAPRALWGTRRTVGSAAPLTLERRSNVTVSEKPMRLVWLWARRIAKDSELLSSFPRLTQIYLSSRPLVIYSYEGGCTTNKCVLCYFPPLEARYCPEMMRLREID